jgi:hypothetical protein
LTRQPSKIKGNQIDEEESNQKEFLATILDCQGLSNQQDMEIK